MFVEAVEGEMDCTARTELGLLKRHVGSTVKPPNKGRIGGKPFIPCREVVREVFF